MKCCIHLASVVKSPVTPFSQTSWAKFVQCTHLWVNLQTIESTVAEKAVFEFKLNSEDVHEDVPANVGFHRECYMLFTNKEHIARARKKREKAANNSEGLYQMYNNIVQTVV